jgi:alpha-glucosidase
VGIFVWKNCNDMAYPNDDYATARAFLDSARRAGAVGVKIDFFDSETKTRVDYQRALLRLAAERRLLVVFHGIQKPTGEARTFPNEISREGIRGVELNLMEEGPIPPSHNAALPFTRYVVGHGDYTPLAYSKPGATTWAHQLATVVQGTSPLLVIAEHPDMLLKDPSTRPALDVLKAIPAAWDETRALPPSKIGELAVIARRSGGTWFLAALNGDKAVQIAPVELSFLEAGRSYTAVEITSPARNQLKRREVWGVTSMSQVPLELAAGDGAVWWFRRE